MPTLYSFTDLKVYWSIRTYFNVHPHLYRNAPRHLMMTFNLVLTFSNYSANCHVLCISCWWIIYPLFFFFFLTEDHSELYSTLKCSEPQGSLTTSHPNTLISQGISWNVASMQGEVGVSGWEGNTRLKPKGTRAKHLPLTWPGGSNDSWEFGEQFIMYSDGWQKASFTYN